MRVNAFALIPQTLPVTSTEYICRTPRSLLPFNRSNHLCRRREVALQSSRSLQHSNHNKSVGQWRNFGSQGSECSRSSLSITALSRKDRADLEFGLSLGVDWVALSFVQCAQDVIDARILVAGRASVMAKIEKPQAVENIESILDVVDALMVARGDLGVEMHRKMCH